MTISDAICAAYIYHFADSRIDDYQRRARHRLGGRFYHTDWVARRYEELILQQAAEILPPGWISTHDYWGAKCLSNQPGPQAPKHGTLMAGDSQGRWLCCTDVGTIRTQLERHTEQ